MLKALIAHRGRRQLAFPILLCLLAGGLGSVPAWTSLTSEELLIVLIAALLCVPVIVRLLQRRFDPFEPTIIFVIAWGVLFVARPIGMLLTNSFEVSTYQVRQGFAGMLFMAFVGAVGFLLAYALPAGTTIGRRLRVLPEPGSAGTAVGYGLIISLIGVLLFVVFIATSGGLGTLKALIAGRQENMIVFLQTSSTSYLSGALALTFPAAMLTFFFALRKRSLLLWMLGIAIAGIGLAVDGPVGIRGWILPYTGGPLILRYLIREKRPGITSLLVLAFIGISLNGFIVQARDSSTRSSTSMGDLFRANLTNAGDTWSRFVMGGDTEMPNLLSLEVIEVPSNIPFQNGTATGEVLVQPIPRAIWPSKPRAGDETLTQRLFVAPGLNSTARQYTPMGNFYLDFGYVGALLGMAGLGLLARIHFEYFRANASNGAVQILYAATLLFLVVLLRGSVGDAAGRLVFIVPPLLLGLHLARARPTPQSVRAVWEGLAVGSDRSKARTNGG